MMKKKFLGLILEQGSNMKKYFIVLSLIMTFTVTHMLPNAALANSIAVVDVKKIMQEAKAAKYVQAQIKNKRDKYRANIKKQEASLRAEEKKLVESRALLAADAFKEKEKAFKEKYQNVLKNAQSQRKKIDAAVRDSIGQIRKNLFIIVEEIAKEKKLDVAVAKSNTLYVISGLDITDEVLKRLNKKLPKVTVK